MLLLNLGCPVPWQKIREVFLTLFVLWDATENVLEPGPFINTTSFADASITEKERRYAYLCMRVAGIHWGPEPIYSDDDDPNTDMQFITDIYNGSTDYRALVRDLEFEKL